MFTEQDQAEIRAGTDRMIAEVRTHRLAEVRKRRHATRVEVAATMVVSRARVAKIERASWSAAESTLAPYVRALGGKPKIVAESHVLS